MMKTDKPGLFTGKKPNFVSKALAAPFNALGNLALVPKNAKEAYDPENMGNTKHGSDWYGKTGFYSETPVRGGTAPTTTMVVPRPTHHYFDLLDGGKKEAHNVQVEQTVDLMNVKPYQAADVKARISAKEQNDAKIREAAQIMDKDSAIEAMGPSSYRPTPAYYQPYK